MLRFPVKQEIPAASLTTGSPPPLPEAPRTKVLSLCIFETNFKILSLPKISKACINIYISVTVKQIRLFSCGTSFAYAKSKRTSKVLIVESC